MKHEGEEEEEDEEGVDLLFNERGNFIIREPEGTLEDSKEKVIYMSNINSCSLP